jgi:hypothetical protein
MTFFHCALEHAWKVHSVLPHKALTKEDGTVQCPLGVHYGKPVGVSDFRVLFCPVVMTYDSVFVSRKNERGQGKRPRLEALNRKNNPQRGMRGIHVGVPRNSKGYLVYVPSMGKIYTSADVYFDGNFNSTLLYEQNKFSGYIDLTITEPMPDTDLPYYQTGSLITFGRKVTWLEIASKRSRTKVVLKIYAHVAIVVESTWTTSAGNFPKTQRIDQQIGCRRKQQSLPKLQQM